MSSFFLIRILGGGVQSGSTRHVGHCWPIVPARGDCEDGEFGGMKIGKGNRSTRRKPAPAPLCPPQIPLDQTRARTQTAAVGSQWLTAWAMALPNVELLVWLYETHTCRPSVKSCANLSVEQVRVFPVGVTVTRRVVDYSECCSTTF
jgi:hypothetical protein